MSDQPPTDTGAAPAAQAAPAPAKARKATDKSARTRAREFALQALYQYLVGRNEAADIDAFTRDLTGFHKADSVHYDALLHGCVAQGEALDAALTPHLDRPLAELSPIEHAVLWIGCYEFMHCIDVPWRVVINECIELAKSFGGTDGHKYVNGVLNPLARDLRGAEVARDEARGKTSGHAGKARPAA
jgi:transcription antitermination protein NusB